MTTYNERCTIVANANGSIKTVFVDQMGIDASGRHYSIGQATIGNDALTQFLGSAHSTALATIVSLEANLATRTSERDSLQGQVDNLTLEKATLLSEKEKLGTDLAEANTTIGIRDSSINDLVRQVADSQVLIDAKDDTIALLQTDNTALQSSVSGHEASEKILQAKIEFLNSIRTYDPNVIRSEAFYQRITGDERFKLGVLALTDDNAKGILTLLDLYLTNEWKVLLDDPQVVGAMKYLGAFILSEGRVAEITRPASREEAYTE